MPRFAVKSPRRSAGLALAFGAAAGLVLLLASDPAWSQRRPSCYPYCDFTHYYGPYDYTYLRPGTYCYPLCRPDGVCRPNPLCIVQAPRGRITVRSYAGAAAATPTAATFYDPSVASPALPRRRARSR
jgi:hypothetical protein